MLTNLRIMVSAYFRASLQIFMKLCMNTAVRVYTKSVLSNSLQLVVTIWWTCWFAKLSSDNCATVISWNGIWEGAWIWNVC